MVYFIQTFLMNLRDEGDSPIKNVQGVVAATLLIRICGSQINEYVYESTAEKLVRLKDFLDRNPAI